MDASAGNEIKDAIKHLDIEYLKDVIKYYKISNISEDEIEIIGKIFSEIKRCEIFKD